MRLNSRTAAAHSSIDWRSAVISLLVLFAGCDDDAGGEVDGEVDGATPLQLFKCSLVELGSSGTLLPFGDLAQLMVLPQLRQLLSVEAIDQRAAIISCRVAYSRKLPATATASANHA